MQTFDAGASKVRHPFEILCGFALKTCSYCSQLEKQGGHLACPLERLAPVIPPLPRQAGSAVLRYQRPSAFISSQKSLRPSAFSASLR
jgi:hypothetical protein